MRAFFLTASRVGTGKDADPIRPAGVDGLTSWAACYDRAPAKALVLAEVTDPKAGPGTFLGLLKDTQDAVGILQGTIATTLAQFQGAAAPTWKDTMVGDPLREDEMTTEQYALAVCAYEPWKVGTVYKVGDLRSYEATLYEVKTAHTAQSDWTPPIVPALFVRRSPAGVIPVWVQPTGAHDAYAKDALVIFNGKVYQSLIPANVWSPTVYPAGWRAV